MNRKLDILFRFSKRIRINDNSKIVIMSDCHRGKGNKYDNFIKNREIYLYALMYYYNRGFTYIELGDGDEMWEVNDYNDIIKNNLNIFMKLKEFYDDDRFIMIYGNHDIYKKYNGILEKYFYKYKDNVLDIDYLLLDKLVVYESLILEYKNKDIFLIHGHQVDFFNSNLWLVSRFLVRSVWRVFERFGISDPTSASKNYKLAKGIDKKLRKWSVHNNKMIIAGHTHRTIYPNVGEDLYFNDGCCVYSDGITCLEIENGRISLIKWGFKVDNKGLVSIERYVIDGDEDIFDFYLNNKNRNK